MPLAVPCPATGLSRLVLRGHVFHLGWGNLRTADARRCFSPSRDGTEVGESGESDGDSRVGFFDYFPPARLFGARTNPGRLKDE